MQGFSLVELSIVLVILGLLTGGILTGQNLIRASELRSVTTELQRFQSATNTFRDKYFALPGDFRDATKFWGSVTTSGGNCTSFDVAGMGTGTQTCDGDGSGTIVDREMHRYWQHLANAGLIEGTFSGVENDTGDLDIGDTGPTANIPNSFGGKLGRSLWVSTSRLWGSMATTYKYPGDYGNYFAFIRSAINHFSTERYILMPEEAWNIDTKLDDGKPATGKVVAFRYTPCTSGASATDLAGEYNLTSTSISCSLIFRNAY